MSDELEDALRRELAARYVPFDESRAEDMIRAAAEAGLANTPRAWVAPLAAAAAVVVVGGGVALATAGGGGNTASGPERAGGPGPSATAAGDANAGPCAPLGSGDTGVGVVVEDSVGAVKSGIATQVPTYVGANEASSAPDLPPPPDSAGRTADPGRQPGTVSPSSAPVATASDLPLHVATEPPDGAVTAVPASEPVDLTPPGGAVICLVGTATPVPAGTASCTKGHHEVTCVSTAYCSSPEDNPPPPPTSSSDGPYSTVLCVDTGSGSFAPYPSGSDGGTPVIGDPCTLKGVCATASGAPASASPDAFSINTKVAPGDTRTFDGGTVPDGQVLRVTALVLQNPAADEGTLTVEGDGANRVTQPLSNFHDLDLHFEDNPLTYDSAHPLRVTVDCANTSTPCTPSVLVVGHLAVVQH